MTTPAADTHREPATLATDPILAEMVRRLVETFHPERVYLFGSRARGDWREDSDYDLLVVVPRSDERPQDRNLRARMALRGLGVSKDIVVLTTEEYRAKQDWVCSLPAIVRREGVAIHG